MARKIKVKYQEGDWFAVPLIGGGYGVGIVARGNYKKAGFLGYFFGPKYNQMPTESDISGKKPQDAILVAIVGDLGIINEEWPILQTTRSFVQEEWPVPLFYRPDYEDESKVIVVDYGSEMPNFPGPIREYKADRGLAKYCIKDELYGYGALQIELTKLLSA